MSIIPDNMSCDITCECTFSVSVKPLKFQTIHQFTQALWTAVFPDFAMEDKRILNFT